MSSLLALSFHSRHQSEANRIAELVAWYSARYKLLMLSESAPAQLARRAAIVARSDTLLVIASRAYQASGECMELVHYGHMLGKLVVGLVVSSSYAPFGTLGAILAASRVPLVQLHVSAQYHAALTGLLDRLDELTTTTTTDSPGIHNTLLEIETEVAGNQHADADAERGEESTEATESPRVAKVSEEDVEHGRRQENTSSTMSSDRLQSGWDPIGSSFSMIRTTSGSMRSAASNRAATVTLPSANTRNNPSVTGMNNSLPSLSSRTRKRDSQQARQRSATLVPDSQAESYNETTRHAHPIQNSPQQPMQLPTIQQDSLKKSRSAQRHSLRVSGGASITSAQQRRLADISELAARLPSPVFNISLLMAPPASVSVTPDGDRRRMVDVLVLHQSDGTHVATLIANALASHSQLCCVRENASVSTGTTRVYECKLVIAVLSAANNTISTTGRHAESSYSGGRRRSNNSSSCVCRAVLEMARSLHKPIVPVRTDERVDARADTSTGAGWLALLCAAKRVHTMRDLTATQAYGECRDDRLQSSSSMSTATPTTTTTPLNELESTVLVALRYTANSQTAFQAANVATQRNGTATRQNTTAVSLTAEKQASIVAISALKTRIRRCASQVSQVSRPLPPLHRMRSLPEERAVHVDVSVSRLVSCVAARRRICVAPVSAPTQVDQTSARFSDARSLTQPPRPRPLFENASDIRREPKHDCFVLHETIVDRKLARHIYSYLIKQEISSWMIDNWPTRSAMSTEFCWWLLKEQATAIECARTVLVCVSGAFRCSALCQMLLKYALHRAKPLLFIIVASKHKNINTNEVWHDYNQDDDDGNKDDNENDSDDNVTDKESGPEYLFVSQLVDSSIYPTFKMSSDANELSAEWLDAAGSLAPALVTTGEALAACVRLVAGAQPPIDDSRFETCDEIVRLTDALHDLESELDAQRTQRDLRLCTRCKQQYDAPLNSDAEVGSQRLECAQHKSFYLCGDLLGAHRWICCERADKYAVGCQPAPHIDLHRAFVRVSPMVEAYAWEPK